MIRRRLPLEDLIELGLHGLDVTPRNRLGRGAWLGIGWAGELVYLTLLVSHLDARRIYGNKAILALKSFVSTTYSIAETKPGREC